MHKEVLQSEVIQGDETPVPVLDRSRDSTRKGYIWTTIGDRAHPYTTFHYTDSRSRDGPAEFLRGYAGYLQTDAYASYESVVNSSAGKIIAVGCRARRAPGILRRTAQSAPRSALRARLDRPVVRRRG